jgi:hypothetical protein
VLVVAALQLSGVPWTFKVNHLFGKVRDSCKHLIPPHQIDRRGPLLGHCL